MNKNIEMKIKKYTLQAEDTAIESVPIRGIDDAVDIVRKFYKSDIDIYESVFVLLLNSGNKTIGFSKISQGGVSGTVIDMKLILKYCIETLASAVILIHNHPSGETTPSKKDLTTTKEVVRVLRFLNIHLHDHIILTSENYYSFAANDLI